MPHYEPYPDERYSENVEGSMEYSRMGGEAFSRIGFYMKVGTVILWSPWVFSLTGIIPRMPSSVFWYSVGGGLAVIMWGFITSGRELDARFSECKNCGENLRKETYNGLDFYVCDRCETYVRGGDSS